MSPSNPLEQLICPDPFAQTSKVRQHACHFCGRTFHRVDVARRHARNCPHRSGQALPNAKRGRRQRACDACSRAKLSCDSKSPCSRCNSRDQACTYGWFYDESSPRLRSGSPVELSTPPERRPIHLPFLLHVTDPSLKSIIEYAISKEPKRDPDGTVLWNSMTPNDQDYMPTDLGRLFFGFTTPFEAQLSDDGDVYSAYKETPPGLTLYSHPDDTISSRLGHLVIDLKDTAALKPELDESFSRFPCAHFFTSANLQRFLKSFYSKRHYQFPLIHWATLNPEKLSLPLLLAVILTGASYSHYEENNVSDGYSLSLLLQVAEKYVFKSLKKHVWSSCSKTISNQHLELCQAALLIIWLHYDCYDDLSIERFITKRLPMLIAVVRKVQLAELKQNSENPEWEAFIHQESCIRFVTWSWFITTLCVFFYNHPPLMTISEMSGHLPCSEELWEAKSKNEFDMRNATVKLDQGPQCLKSLVSGLLGEEWTEEMRESYEQLSIHHLHGLVLSLQPVIFNVHTGKLPTDHSPTFIRALDRWDNLWESAMRRTPIDQIKWLGVSRNGHEISSLSRRIIEVNRTEQASQSMYLQRIPVTNLSTIHQFIRQYCCKDVF
ncbi:hypothetical protein BX600DRAFT_83123 [Xylariales sp. PMI_506]|nr:hypothetical protein BX600DRAFT_83123 [Xylariales sp. PMI_506]